MRNAILLILLIVCIFPGAGFGAEGKQGSRQEGTLRLKRKALRRLMRRPFARQRKNLSPPSIRAMPNRIGALWTTDCEYVDETGRIFRGRDSIEKEYAAFFAANPGLKMETSISSIRIIGGKSAMEDGTAIVKNASGAVVSKGSYTALHLKDGDKWLMASVREHALPSLSKRPGLRRSRMVDRRLECSKRLQDPGLQLQMDCGEEVH